MGDPPNCKLFEERMSGSRCYLDYNATAPLRDSAARACVEALQLVGNPSSIHAEGREARRVIEAARRAVGALLGAPADRVIFTSGGTEGANLALTPDLSTPRAATGTCQILVSATEHAAVLRGHRFAGADVRIVAVDHEGRLDLAELARCLEAAEEPVLLALQAANNETGVIQPIVKATRMVHAAGGVVVCDAVQAAGRLPIDLASSGVDVAILSAHKLGGPKGVGAVVLGAGVSLGGVLVRGGGQERGLRSGTENVPGIAGFGAAAEAAMGAEDAPRLRSLQHRLEAGIASLDPEAVVFGAGVPRLCNTTCFSVPGLAAETLLMALDLEGIALSSGSACSSGKVTRSHVLDAMGVPPALASGALRVSTGHRTTTQDIDRCLEALATVMQRMQRRPVRAAA